MARYSGPVCRLCRREGMKLYLKGEKCYTEKCPVVRRAKPPGMHAETMRRKVSEFAVRLREKQRLRRIYGVLETQFRRYFAEAARFKGITGTRLLQLLETRLDNVIYRLGLCTSRKEARQAVVHGHITVNGRKVTIPSYNVAPSDVIGLTARGRAHPVIKENAVATGRGRPSWLEFDSGRAEGRVLALPAREEIDVPINEQLVVEFYSR
ncbi:MAG: 30S ribosomal protein S4 [Armatimonadetes bacterium]|nr:30S ribosomal protein S4 [Armatimonadota bacterium]